MKAAACRAKRLPRWAHSRSRSLEPGAIESLNVAATVNICQYELNRPS